MPSVDPTGIIDATTAIGGAVNEVAADLGAEAARNNTVEERDAAEQEERNSIHAQALALVSASIQGGPAGDAALAKLRLAVSGGAP